MVSPNRKKHKTIKGILLIVIFFMALSPILFYSVSEVEVSDVEIANKPHYKKPEQPLHDVELPDFLSIRHIPDRKQAFFEFLKPAIEKENQRLNKLRHTIMLLAEQHQQGETLSNQQVLWLTKLSKSYRVNPKWSIAEQLSALLVKVDEIPRQLVLVQAANESAWGSSRFAKIGLNFFGIWCFKQGCGMVPNGRDAGLRHEVAAFDSVDDVIGHYFLNINSNAAYNMLRQIRAQLREHDVPLQADILATGLLPYSERGIDYVVEINTMLRHNRRYL
ncbi:glucosaminidase domain-containing protein [Thalassotalea sp. Y01]|uniref:glucosaminidase domain-containing protein n=1 Tax=Thalassotalea sp. Y01 TaxID=2729613 RepID=UPI00145F79D1|nr:glucosaminidase domain-containing protein [Thalassotalea sp. Y01]NMP15510.1 glucosaminidase [Thalassotalea sp. Y01]